MVRKSYSLPGNVSPGDVDEVVQKDVTCLVMILIFS